MQRTEIRHTQRLCKCINEPVDLTVKVVVLKAGTPASEIKVYTQKWLDCSKKNGCGKKCNYFHAPPDCDCTACDEKDLVNFP